MRYGRAVCGDLDVAESREWLLANGRGGYAMGTVAGTLTRRYHGLLVAALDPPAVRRLVLARCDLDVAYDGQTFGLSTNRWRSGARVPEGWRLLESFALDDGLPTWTYACGDALLELTLAMPLGSDAVALALRVLRGRAPLGVRARLVVADRDHHGGPLPPPAAFATAIDGDAATIALPACGRTLHVAAPGAALTAASDVYAGYLLVRETERGLQDVDDYAHVLDAAWTLAEGGEAGIVASIDGPAVPDAHAVVARRRAHNRARVAGEPTPLLQTLALAADAFVVARDAPCPGGASIIAGYPWFADWGRDAMIALPGLLLNRGRGDDAAAVLRTFAAALSDGLVPNAFAEDGGGALYNSVDAALWFVEALRAYVATTGDRALPAELFSVVEAILEAYRAGTRYGIALDADGLIRAGTPSVQVTWMDAKTGDRVVTPRSGKPVEIAALWYNALAAAAALSDALGLPSTRFRTPAQRAAAAMERFWSAERGWCLDVLDGPDGDDASLRPNQLFAVALPASAFDDARARAIVDVCAARLWTPMGLRTLDPADPRYVGRYGGPQTERDAGYHQGTVWPWLIGPFARAHLRAYRDPARTRTFVQPLLDALEVDALGTLCEIADGDPPHAARGCPAQAWSVGELIATLRLLSRHGDA